MKKYQNIFAMLLLLAAIILLSGCEKPTASNLDGDENGPSLMVTGVSYNSALVNGSFGKTGGFNKVTMTIDVASLPLYRPNAQAYLWVLDAVDNTPTQEPVDLGYWDYDAQMLVINSGIEIALPKFYEHLLALEIGGEFQVPILTLEMNTGVVHDLVNFMQRRVPPFGTIHVAHVYVDDDEGVGRLVQNQDNSAMVTKGAVLWTDLSSVTHDLSQYFANFPPNTPEHPELIGYWLAPVTETNPIYLRTQYANAIREYTQSSRGDLFPANMIECDGRNVAFYAECFLKSDEAAPSPNLQYGLQFQRATVPNEAPFGGFFATADGMIEARHVMLSNPQAIDRFWHTFAIDANNVPVVGQENRIFEFGIPVDSTSCSDSTLWSGDVSVYGTNHIHEKLNGAHKKLDGMTLSGTFEFGPDDQDSERGYLTACTDNDTLVSQIVGDIEGTNVTGVFEIPLEWHYLDGTPQGSALPNTGGQDWKVYLENAGDGSDSTHILELNRVCL